MSLVFAEPEGRGRLTEELFQYYMEKTKRVLTREELRLLPFIMYVFHNDEKLSNINSVEINILKSLNEEGFIDFGRKHHDVGYYDLNIKPEFYKICNELLYQSYAIKVKNSDENNELIKENLNFENLKENKKVLILIKNALQNNGKLITVNKKMKQALNKKDIDFLDGLKARNPNDILIESIDEGSVLKIGCSKEFWNEMNKVLF